MVWEVFYARGAQKRLREELDRVKHMAPKAKKSFAVDEETLKKKLAAINKVIASRVRVSRKNRTKK